MFSGISLLYIGAVLFVIGILYLGKVDPKGAAVLALLTGTLAFIIDVSTGIINYAHGGPGVVYFFAGTGLLFAFTYLYVGIVNLFGLDPRALGWYCLYVVIVAIPAGVIEMFTANDAGPFNGLGFAHAQVVWPFLWWAWAFLWFVFFLNLALGKLSSKFVAWSTFITGALTTGIPGFLMISTLWK